MVIKVGFGRPGYGFVVDSRRLTQPTNKPFPELGSGEPSRTIEGNIATTSAPATASTGSASAYVVDSERLTQPTNKPTPELVEGKGDTQVVTIHE